MTRTVVVVGGGVAGLTVAFELRERAGRDQGGLEVLCLEAANRVGGNIRTDRVDGFLCEWGPNGFLDNVRATLDLVGRAGLNERLLPSDAAAARRFLYRRGRLWELPTGPLTFLASRMLSWSGRLRAMGEPFLPARRTSDDESVFDFASRRIGREAAAILVDAMIGGIYAGDSRRLSLRSTFPKLWRLETQHGGLVRGMLTSRGKARASGAAGGGPAGPGGHLTSFRDGLQELPDALARALGGSVRLRTRVTQVTDMGVRGFRVHLMEGAPIDASAVVLAVPAWHAAEMVSAVDRETASAMGAIPSAPVAVVHLGFDETDLPRPLGGFGFLAPRGEGLRVLGTLWSSCIFPNRAPSGRVLLTTMLGGAHDPEALDLDDEALVEAVRHDLRIAMGLTSTPVFARIFRHRQGIPQYTLGHGQRLEVIERRLQAHRGLLVCGNSYRGISVNSCVEEAPGIAEAVIAMLAP